MMASPLPLLLFTFCGFVEWLLYGWRLKASVDGRWLVAASLASLEVLLGLWVFKAYSAGADMAGICYAIGCGIGTAVGICKKKAPQNLSKRKGPWTRYKSRAL